MSTTCCSTTKQSESPDHDSITKVLQTYLQGGRSADADLMRTAFHSTATIHGYIDGSLLAGPIDLLFGWVSDNPPASTLNANIVSIDTAHTIATARVEITDWLGHRFTDQFTLLQEDGVWRITSKVFHTH